MTLATVPRPNRKRDYANTVQMRFFVMHGTAKRNERN